MHGIALPKVLCRSVARGLHLRRQGCNNPGIYEHFELELTSPSYEAIK